jgi:hypothetical protein
LQESNSARYLETALPTSPPWAIYPLNPRPSINELKMGALSFVLNSLSTGGAEEYPYPISEGTIKLTGSVSGVYFLDKYSVRGRNSRKDPRELAGTEVLKEGLTWPTVCHDDRLSIFLLREQTHEVNGMGISIMFNISSVIGEVVDPLLD